jgi:DNA polymerase-3 subunit gamma/tau
MTKALYRKWRPQNWDEVASQEHIIQTLRNAVMHDRVAHAYLFAGPRGTGKTTSARLLAKAVNCLDPSLDHRPCNTCEHCQAINAGRFMDLIEIDAASNTSVDDVRELRDKINFSPSQGRFKVYIIDEVHMLSTAAFNALLKTLEEPPPHAIFILATTEIHKIPATVLSRCQRHEFRRIPLADIVEFLKKQCASENLKVDDAVFIEIARQATGSLRDAISLLDQLTSTTDQITLEMAQNVLGTATNQRVIDLVEALLEENPAGGLSHIHNALDNGTDPRQFARQIVTYLRNVLLYKMGNMDQVEVPEELRPILHEHASRFELPGLLQAIEAFNDATVEEHANWHPGLGLELAFTAYLAGPQLVQAQPAESQQKPGEKKPSQPESKPEIKKPPKKEKPKETAQGSPPSPQKPSVARPEDSPSDETETLQPQETLPVSGEGLSVDDIINGWERVKAQVGRHNKKVEAFLNSCKVVGLKSGVVILGFQSQILKDLWEKEGNLNLTSDVLEDIFGQPLSIKCVVTTHQGGSVPTSMDIEKDGMVGTATRDLGGKISKAEEIDHDNGHE